MDICIVAYITKWRVTLYLSGVLTRLEMYRRRFAGGVLDPRGFKIGGKDDSVQSAECPRLGFCPLCHVLVESWANRLRHDCTVP